MNFLARASTSFLNSFPELLGSSLILFLLLLCNPCIGQTRSYEQDSLRGENLFEKAAQFWKEKKYKAALEQLDLSQAAFSGNYKVFFVRGSIFFNQGHFEAAIKEFDKSLALNSQQPKAFQRRGAARLSLDQFQEALADFDQATAMDPSDAKNYFYKGLYYFKRRNWVESQSNVDASLQLNDADRQAIKLKGFLCYWLDDFDECVRWLTRSIIMDEPDLMQFYVRGKAYTYLAQKGRRQLADSAILDLTTYYKSGSKAQNPLPFLGLAHALKGDTIIARDYFRQTFEVAPNDTISLELGGQTEFLLGNYEKSLEYFQRALAALHGLDLNLFYNLAVAYEAACDDRSALVYFKKAIGKGSKGDLDYRESRIVGFVKDSTATDLIYDDINVLLATDARKEQFPALQVMQAILDIRRHDVRNARRTLKGIEAIGQEVELLRLMNAYCDLAGGEKVDVIQNDIEVIEKGSPYTWHSALMAYILSKHLREDERAKSHIKHAAELNPKLNVPVNDFFAKGKAVNKRYSDPGEMIALFACDILTKGTSFEIDCPETQ